MPSKSRIENTNMFFILFSVVSLVISIIVFIIFIVTTAILYRRSSKLVVQVAVLNQQMADLKSGLACPRYVSLGEAAAVGTSGDKGHIYVEPDNMKSVFYKQWIISLIYWQT